MTIWQRCIEGVLVAAPASRSLTHWETLLSNLYGSTSLTPAKRGRDSLRVYQHKTIDIIKSIWAEGGPPGVIVALEPGAGKTVSTLTAISELLAEGKIKRVLLVAPLLVAETVWDAEIEEWEHLTGLRCSKLLGDLKARSAAFEDDAPLHIINRENIPWLWDHAKDRWPYDALVIDEASMLKNGKKRTPNRKLSRFGALAQARKHFTGVVELTGTPAPNGVQNLWGLAYIIDQGERLCKTQSAFDQRWMNFNKYTFERKAKPGAEEDIMSRIKDIMVSLDPADYSQLPPLVENNIRVTLPPKVMEEYLKFKKTLVYDPLDVEAVNAAVLTNKLLQACNGSIFDEDGKHHHIHDCKLDALVDLHAECGGIPLLVAYTYKFDLDRIKSKFPNALVLNQQKDVMKTVRDWNEGKIDMLLAHPASAAHGLNLQKGSNISVWYGLTADLELFQQFNKRLWRSGQQAKVVFSHRIIAAGTHDEEILPILDSKDAVQSRILRATQVSLSQ